MFSIPLPPPLSASCPQLQSLHHVSNVCGGDDSDSHVERRHHAAAALCSDVEWREQQEARCDGEGPPTRTSIRALLSLKLREHRFMVHVSPHRCRTAASWLWCPNRPPPTTSPPQPAYPAPPSADTVSQGGRPLFSHSSLQR